MDKYWFKPKEYGWGFGYPIAWQGWMALIALILSILDLGFVTGVFMKVVSLKVWLIYFINVFVISAVFCVLFQNKVEGGLKWRWGKDKK